MRCFTWLQLNRISTLNTVCHSPWVPVVCNRKLSGWDWPSQSILPGSLLPWPWQLNPALARGRQGVPAPVGSTDRAQQDGHGLKSTAHRTCWMLHRLSNAWWYKEIWAPWVGQFYLISGFRVYPWTWDLGLSQDLWHPDWICIWLFWFFWWTADNIETREKWKYLKISVS